MKHLYKQLPPRQRRHCTISFIFIALLLFTGKLAAQPPLLTTCASALDKCFSCSIFASSNDNLGGAQIYDDGGGNYYTDNGTPGFFNWNCGDRFLLVEYTTQATSVQLSFGYNSGITGTGTQHEILVTNPDGSTSGPFLVNDDTVFYPASYSSLSQQGAYTFQYYRPYVWDSIQAGITTGDLFPDITAALVLIRPITSISLAVHPICSTYSDTQYVFQVITTPPLDSLLLPDTYTVPPSAGGPDCDDASAQPCSFYSLNFNGSLPASSSSGFALNVSTTNNCYSPSSDIILIAVTAIPLLTGCSPNPDLVDYTISNTGDTLNFGDLSTYLIHNASSGNYGQAPVISVTISDYFTTYPAASALIPISFPASVAQPGNPSGTPPGPPNATGIPGPSYDIFDYTVSGNEEWSPGNNPMANMRTLGDTVSTITIQDNLTIPPGTSLILMPGMKLEMGPGSHIDVMQYPGLSVSPGGVLAVLGNDTITGYTACDGSYSMWGGIRVWGNPDLPQYLPDGTGYVTAGSPQGTLNLIGQGAISYADTAVYLGPAVDNPFADTCRTCRFAPPTNGGGGNIWAQDYLFYNNNYGVVFSPYSIIPPAGYNTANFYGCKFNSDNPTTVPTGTLIDIWGQNIRGINIAGDTFENNISTGGIITYGIYADNMGFSTQASIFSNFQTGIYHAATSASYAPNITGATFNNNIIGAELSGSMGAVVVNNTFNVPKPLYPITTFVTSIRTIGLLLNGATAFTIHNNTLKAPLGYSTAGATTGANNTVGILATSVGGDNQEIWDNSYTGFGTANLSNYTNRNNVAGSGLWYSCNANNENQFDIATEGSNPLTDGIRPYQGYPNGTFGYGYGLSAANTFSAPSAPGCYSLYYDVAQTAPFNYYYAATDPSSEIPGHPPTTAPDNVAAYTVIAGDNCTEALPGSGPRIHYFGRFVIVPDGKTDAVTAHLDILNNINYYMTDSLGIPHRDSLYYWVGQLQTPYGALMITNMLIEDSLLDSAYTLYNQIPATYPLDSAEYYEFTNWGSELMAAQVIPLLASGVPSKQFAYLKVDTTTTDGRVIAMQTQMLTDVFTNARMWAHIRAENMLNDINPSLLNKLITITPDTLIYPDPPPPPCPGVLTVTELSNGPASLSGCNYGQMLVSGCGRCSSPTANVQGWIIDDNSGNFNLSGCTVFGGITQSHYRLSYDSVWANVPVGSIIVIYNADSNCYNLPDSFSIVPNAGKTVSDKSRANISTASTYFVPIGGTELSPLGKPHVQRFKYNLDSSICNYVVDTITDSTNDSVYYETACEWDSTINFDTTTDAFQVRCPRCGRDMSTQPAFYHGFGYGADTGANQYAGIPADSNSLGAAVLNSAGAGHKYSFTGSTATDLASSAAWQALPADAAGAPPATIGTMPAAFANNVRQNNLNLPCCSPTYQHHHNDARNGNGSNSDSTGARSSSGQAIQQQAGSSIQVFPNPATNELIIQMSPGAYTSFTITNSIGQAIIQQPLSAPQTNVNVAPLTPGLYYITFRGNNGTTVQKFVKM